MKDSPIFTVKIENDLVSREVNRAKRRVGRRVRAFWLVKVAEPEPRLSELCNDEAVYVIFFGLDL